MGKKEDKALELVKNGKQSQFDGIPEREPREDEKKKRVTGRVATTYWRCKNSHIFMIKCKVLKERLERLRCPECGAKVENKVGKSTYLYYLHKQGRGHEGKYRKSISKLDTDKHVSKCR